MAKVIAPLFSFGASGKLANSLVYMKWKGIDDVRQFVVPANPKTASQQAQRGRMTDAVAKWHATSWNATDLTAWNLYASVQTNPMSGFNVFCKEYITAAKAGKSWNSLYDITIGTPSGGSITITIKCGSDKTAKLYIGTTKTSQPSAQSGTYASGTWTFNITGLSAGVVYYFYIANTSGSDGARTGLYSFTGA